MSKWKKRVSPNTGETAWIKRNSDNSQSVAFTDPTDPTDPKEAIERKKAQMILKHIAEVSNRG